MKLKPCPFCGTQPDKTVRQDECLWSHNIVDWTQVRCWNCDVQFEWPEGIDVVAQWNRRYRWWHRLFNVKPFKT